MGERLDTSATINGRPACAGSLAASDLERFSKAELSALLAYLNLPPLGAYDDAAGPPRPGTDEAHEVRDPLRARLLERRERLGGEFGEPKDLLGVEGFDGAALGALCERLRDLSRYGHRLRPVWGGPEAERELFALLQGAERSIHIVTLIMGGEVGVRLARLLAEKVRQGVQVRVMFAASGFVMSGSPSTTGFVSPLSELRSWLWHDRYVRKNVVGAIREGGVPFVDCNPIIRHWKRKLFRDQGIRSRDGYRRWAKERGIRDEWLAEQDALDEAYSGSIAHGDHRKMIVVDGCRAFIGSQNLADAYLYSNELSPDPRVNWKRWQWHDNSAILEGGCARELNRQFAKRWALSGGDVFDPDSPEVAAPLERKGDAVVTVHPSLPLGFTQPFWKNFPRLVLSLLGGAPEPVTEGYSALRERIGSLPELARHSMHVEHCYPTDGELLRRWGHQANRLSEFLMVVPLYYDTLLTGFESDRFYPMLQRLGVNLQGYQRAIVHSKIAVADRFYTALGSYNLVLRSARADLELEFFVQDRQYGQAVVERIVADTALCRPVRPSVLDRIRSRLSIPFFDAFMRYFLL